MTQPDLPQDRIDFRQVAFRHSPAQMWYTAQEHRIKSGHPTGFVTLGHIPDAPGDLRRRHLEDIPVIHQDPPGPGPNHGVQAAEKGGFSHPVGAQNGEDSTPPNGEPQVAQNQAIVPVADANIPYRQHYRIQPRMRR